MKKTKDLDQFKYVLPYSSELFGVYQPLIGWKSRRILSRIEKGYKIDKGRILAQMFKNIAPEVDVHVAGAGAVTTGERPSVKIRSLRPGALLPDPGHHQSFFLDELTKRLPPRERLTDADLDAIVNADRFGELLDGPIKERLTDLRAAPGFDAEFRRDRADPDQAMVAQAARESRIATYLLEIKKAGQRPQLEELLYGKAKKWVAQAANLAAWQNPLDVMDPHKDLDRVTVSPISIVHLFRQYFFEFDTFLGTPVSHVWLSPGSSVELVEVSTRRTLTERTFETEVTTTIKAESSTTEEDEISEAVKEDNRKNTAFGFNTSVHQGWVGGSADASASINLENTQQKSRERTHRHMRQQTEKVSSEIRKNYKSTFKTVSEVTDTSSKRYVLNNTTDRLVNYELRRKMRQVGVQVQDVGTYLCWQTYVDDPGRRLGVSEMVHLAKSPDISHLQPPEAPPTLETYVMEKSLTIPFKPRTEDTNDSDMDESYYKGVEVNLDVSEGTPEKIDHTFRFTETCDKPDYEFAGGDNSVILDVGGNDMQADARNVSVDGNKVSFTVYMTHVNFHNQPTLIITARTFWTPSQALTDKMNAEYLDKVEKYNAETQREFEKAHVEAARERVKLASRITPRKFEDLREEERITVYRALIQDMLTSGLPLKDNRTHHAVAELLNSIFDIDKMLYFVAPEWWRPRLHHSHQVLGRVETAPSAGGSGGGGGGITASAKAGTVYDFAKKGIVFEAIQQSGIGYLEGAATHIDPRHVVGWGGEYRKDNYYITDESDPAKLGSSLGWLLQLDGDNQRNAFLNAPWVKAVIPIRPGREKAAFNWLQRVHVEGADGLNATYAAPASELGKIPHAGPTVTIKDAINHLCDLVAQKHQDSLESGQYPEEEINDDNKVSATPIDKVYEHGFYPNQDGFKLLMGKNFEVFDQWIEILPTDQVVPVEVEYDPITGRQVQIVQGGGDG